MSKKNSKTKKNIKDLKSEIDQWDEKIIKRAIIVLNDYYGLIIPIDLMRDLLKKDLVVAHEVFSGGISDTEQREQLCELVLDYLRVPKWPTYGDSNEYKENFKKILLEAALNHNINVEVDFT